MTGRLYERDNKYKAKLHYKDKNNEKAQKWVSTGIPYVKGNKKKAEQKLAAIIEQYKYLEYNESDKPLFIEAVNAWLDRQH
jgi:hypothetical protein